MPNEGSDKVEQGLDADPLGIDKLSVDYDYLLYKIRDHVESIQLQTTQLCRTQNELVTNEIVENIIDRNISEFKLLLEKCEELENHFDMLDQIAIITESFNDRISAIIADYKQIKRR
ncbi:hypothetical protein NCAS_0F03230 [Naumovozyma castellii]|uniref:Biogenesis of lysosome-related organelles complex 1 subunit CNL1 n=1 Tax=Naumovozyma castellii TaxID=27288 RepID=G0VH35_NAUCA|nr:hypothetical protein NCAS_0F03230 [Naumovozyma castellii CBS 4309]CCC70807.1 hypothetical protein NCAS_0F03230 [Naumovozyma castellii CBS 4309]